MAFIRERKTADGPAFYVVETYRQGGKVRHRYIVNLGQHSSFSAAIEAAEGLLARLGRMSSTAMGWHLAGLEGRIRELRRLQRATGLP